MNFLGTDVLAIQHQDGEMPLKALLKTARTLMDQIGHYWHKIAIHGMSLKASLFIIV